MERRDSSCCDTLCRILASYENYTPRKTLPSLPPSLPIKVASPSQNYFREKWSPPLSTYYYTITIVLSNILLYYYSLPAYVKRRMRELKSCGTVTKPPPTLRNTVILPLRNTMALHPRLPSREQCGYSNISMD